MPDIRRIAGDVYLVRGIVLSSRKTPVGNAGYTVTDLLGGGSVPVYEDEMLRVRKVSLFADSEGNFSFYVPAGQYRIIYTSGSDSFHVPDDVVIAGSQHSRHEVRKNGTRVGMRRATNFIPGGGIAVDVVDDPENDEVDVSVTATAGAGFGAPTKTIDIGDTAEEGVALSSLRADAQLAFPAPAVGYPRDVAAAELDGVSTKPARDDHIHAHGEGYLPNAHHNQVHSVGGTDHTGVISDIPGIITDAQHGARGPIVGAHGHDDLDTVLPDQHHARSHAVLSVSDHTGIQAFRITTGSIAVQAQVELTVTLPTAFADTNYTVVVSIRENTTEGMGSGLRLRRLKEKTATNFSVIIQNENLITAVTGTLEVIVIHD